MYILRFKGTQIKLNLYKKGFICYRNHIRPSISKCLLFAGMFSHPSLGTMLAHDNQAGDQQDWGLEFAESEVRSAFL